MTETTILDFRLSNTFEGIHGYLNATEKRSIFSKMGLNVFFISAHIEMIQADQQ